MLSKSNKTIVCFLSFLKQDQYCCGENGSSPGRRLCPESIVLGIPKRCDFSVAQLSATQALRCREFCKNKDLWTSIKSRGEKRLK